jgi:hypothetical protein
MERLGSVVGVAVYNLHAQELIREIEKQGAPGRYFAR